MSDSNNCWEEAIENSIRDSLDRMAMLDLTIDPEATVSPDTKKGLRIAMQIQGEAAKRIELRLSRQLAGVWSAALTGVDEDELDGTDVEDGACELLNMVAGATKTRLGELGIEFDLGIPEVAQDTSDSPTNSGQSDPIRFQGRVGDDPLEIIVVLD